MNFSPKFSGSRRHWLSSTLRVTLLGVSAGTPVLFAAGASAAQSASNAPLTDKRPSSSNTARPGNARFMALSQLLTGKTDLDPIIGARTLDALCATDPAFATRFAALDTACALAHPLDMGAFDESTVGRTPALRATAVEIVRAWYTGTVGTGRDARVLAYRDALMYRPTAGITTVPSYQLGGFGYWVAKPA